MIEQKIKVGSSIEARPAALLVQTASKYLSSIKIKVEDKTVNVKSIMGMISIGILDGQDVTLIVEGQDEKVAAKELKEFLTK